MSKLTILRSSTPVGALVPEFLTQKCLDETANKIYISNGLTNTDWVEVGGGGGGSATSIVTLSDVTSTGGSPQVDFKMDEYATCIVRLDGHATGEVKIGTDTTALGANEIAHGKLILLCGDDGAAGNVTFTFKGDDFEMGTLTLVYIDEHDALSAMDTSAAPSSIAKTFQNEIVVYDILAFMNEHDTAVGNDGTIIITKIGQYSTNVTP